LVAIISVVAVRVFAPDAARAVVDVLKGGSLRPFDVVDIPGRGKGVVAIRNIKVR
jgi:hypothetical protein